MIGYNQKDSKLYYKNLSKKGRDKMNSKKMLSEIRKLSNLEKF